MGNEHRLSDLYEQLERASRQGFFRDYYSNRNVIYIAFFWETHKETMHKINNYIIDNYGEYIREMYFTENYCLKIYLHVP
jgi:hypothetical protein